MKLKAPIFRDGTSQRSRSLAALQPDYVAADERSLADQLQFVQEFSKHLRYFNLDNQPQGSWENFFTGDLPRLLAYVEAPETFLPQDAAELTKLSAPHLALLVSFLKLYQYPQQQFKDLTQRYLDFYYRTVLQLSEKSAVPDHAHVIFSLRPEEKTHKLEAGTLLSAGPDSQGIEQRYALDDDLYLNQAQVASVKTLSVEKINVDLKVIHQRGDRTEEAFEAVLRWAIGTPQQGDRLPNFPHGEPDDVPYSLTEITNLFQTIKDYKLSQITDDQQHYILNQLCFATIEDFKTCLDVHDREMRMQQGDREVNPPMQSEWETVYGLIERAYRKKINRDRRHLLRDEHNKEDYADPAAAFLGMVQLALGEPPGDIPAPTDPLPLLPAGYSNLEALFTALTQSESDLTAAQYVKEQLYLTVDDFQTIMEIKQQHSEDLEAPGWKEVYRLLEKAQSKKRGFTYPPIGQIEIKGITAAGITDDAAIKPSQSAVLSRFNSFTPNLPNAEQPATTAQPVGVALTSPVLLLSEGNREITVTLACEPSTFDREFLGELIEQGNNPFEVSISSESGWITTAKADLSVRAGDFVLEKPLNMYEHDNIQPVYQSIEDTPFTLSDVGQFLRLKDGGLYEIAEVRSDNTVKLQRANGLLPPVTQVVKYQKLSPVGSYSDLGSLTYSDAQQSISTQSDRFSESDVDKFVMLGNGTIYQITRFATARSVEVRFWGHLPGDGKNKKYEQIALTSLANLAELEIISVALPTEKDNRFSAEDVGNCLVWEAGQVYKMKALVSDREAQVQYIGRLQNDMERATTISQYSAAGVYVSSLQFSFTLSDTEAEITAPPADDSIIQFETDYPVIKIILTNPAPEDDAGNIAAYYSELKDLCLTKASVKVAVTDVKALEIRSDRTTLNPKSPFEPYSREPKTGAGFYFFHPEIAYKKLDGLSVHLDWMGLPNSFATHYEAYYSCGLSTLPNNIDNNSFQGQLQLMLNRSWQPVRTQSLFDSQGETLQAKTTLNYEKSSFESLADYGQVAPATLLSTDSDVLEQPRFFKLELTSHSFLHDAYSLVFNKIYRAGADERVAGENSPLIQSLTVYPAYTPEVKSISLGYQASTEIDLSAPEAITEPDRLDRLFQLHPFGYVDMLSCPNSDKQHSGRCLLPQYDYAGELFIGLSDLQPLQSVTLLMQMVAGSADVELLSPAVEWSYLGCDHWHPFQNTEILADSTNGLIDTGILKFKLPETATNQNPLMPRGLHWLRATVTENATAIPDTLDIRTQAVKITFVDQGNAPDHYSKPLAAGSLNSLVTRNDTIETVNQPYSSFGGRMPEIPDTFYTRVSERLRHKRRALTTWDYERLVLEQFPQIYKVKCLSQSEQQNEPNAAHVTVVVIPDIANTAPFYPLEPKAPLYLLKEIEQYLQAHTSPFVKIVVKNPHYEQIKYRIGVRFKDGYEQGTYLNQLNQEIVQFLSPWAYEAQADIAFGSSLHSSAVIYFVETRPYVDYVTNLKLIEQTFIGEKSPQPEINTTFRVNTTNLAEVSRPDSILVSAPKHLIDIITTENYDAEDFEGIDYMIVDLDFTLT